MASDSSFDVFSQIDRQELVNAVDQTQRDVRTRYDLKDSKTELVLGDKELTITADAELHIDAVRDILETKAVRRNRPQVEVGLLFLGTLGNNAPFIGLFGTVLGIMTSFRQLGSAQGASGMDNVMGSIGEALTATAIGILVALPAVIGYNIFMHGWGKVTGAGLAGTPARRSRSP